MSDVENKPDLLKQISEVQEYENFYMISSVCCSCTMTGEEAKGLLKSLPPDCRSKVDDVRVDGDADLVYANAVEKVRAGLAENFNADDCVVTLDLTSMEALMLAMNCDRRKVSKQVVGMLYEGCYFGILKGFNRVCQSFFEALPDAERKDFLQQYKYYTIDSAPFADRLPKDKR